MVKYSPKQPRRHPQAKLGREISKSQTIEEIKWHDI